MISDKALLEFKELWKQDYGEELSDERAAEEAINLLTFFNATYRPIKKEWNDEYETKNNR